LEFAQKRFFEMSFFTHCGNYLFLFFFLQNNSIFKRPFFSEKKKSRVLRIELRSCLRFNPRSKLAKSANPSMGFNLKKKERKQLNAFSRILSNELSIT